VGIICVIKGRLKVYITNENGKEMTLYRLFDNDVCVLSGSCGVKNISFEVQVRAEEETQLITIPGTAYHNLESKYPEVSQFTSEMMAARLSDVMWTLEQVAFSSMDKRVASLLIEQRAMVQSDEIMITHDEIARDLGTAREVVSRMLKYFQNEDWITQGRGKVYIKNPSALLSLSD
jgi:CRP/FNR family transcriptional regulator